MSYRNDLNFLYSKRHFERCVQLDGEFIALCYYCDAIAQHRDHVPPLSFIRDEILIGNYDIITKFDLVIVPACVRCNLTLAARQLLTLEDRRRFIRAAKTTNPWLELTTAMSEREHVELPTATKSVLSRILTILRRLFSMT